MRKTVSKGTKAQRHKGTKAKEPEVSRKDAKAQKNTGTKAQRHKSTKVSRVTTKPVVREKVEPQKPVKKVKAQPVVPEKVESKKPVAGKKAKVLAPVPEKAEPRKTAAAQKAKALPPVPEEPKPKQPVKAVRKTRKAAPVQKPPEVPTRKTAAPARKRKVKARKPVPEPAAPKRISAKVRKLSNAQPVAAQLAKQEKKPRTRSKPQVKASGSSAAAALQPIRPPVEKPRLAAAKPKKLSSRIVAFWDGETCELCGGMIQARLVDLPRKIDNKYVLVRNVPAGVCRTCGQRHFSADVLKTLEDLPNGGLGESRRKVMMEVYEF